MSDIFALPPKQLLIKLLAPIAAGFVMLMCIDFADVLVAGFISDTAMAILGYSYALIYFMIAIGFGLNQGLTIIGSEAYIHSGKQKLYHIFMQSVVLSILCAVVLFVLTMVFLSSQWIDSEILPHIDMLRDYLMVILWAILPMFLLLIVCALCQIQGRPEVIRDTLAAMLVLTVVLHPLLALPTGATLTLFNYQLSLPFGYGLGLVGIASSKLIVTMLGLGFAVVRVIDASAFFQSNLRFSLTQTLALSKQSFPAAAIQLLVPIYLIMLTKTVTNYGLTAIAGFTLGYRIVMVVIIPILGVLVALLVVMTHDLVSKNYLRVKETLKLSLIWGSVVVFAVLLLSNLITAYGFDFLKKGEIEYIAQQYLVLALYITVLEYLIGICIVSFQSIRSPKIAFCVASLRTIVVPVPILYWVNTHSLSMVELWYMIALSFTIATIGSVLIGYYGFWKKALN